MVDVVISGGVESVSSFGISGGAHIAGGAQALKLGTQNNQMLLQGEALKFGAAETLAVSDNLRVRESTSAKFVSASAGFLPFDITNAAPLIGKAEVRTVSIAERLEAPKANEAKDYTTSTRYEAVRGLIALADTLEAEDGGDAPGLFEGVVFHGVRGDPALFWSEANVWCLCKTCHDSVKQREERRAGR